MGYLTQNEIGSNQSMLNRIAQAVAQETQSVEADRYAYEHRRIWSASPSWDSAWESALVTHPEPEYDPGADEGVITDGMILS
ncbi:MAG: hypothetical protein ABWY25_00550, partial [Paenisporosarcina sp.]